MRLLTTLLLCSAALAQENATVKVDAASQLGPWQPVWAFLGLDAPNETYTPEGGMLLGELAALSVAPVYMGAHNLLNSGDGTPALRWGSTNMYTKAPAGYPVYNWTVGDRIVDSWHNAHFQAFMGIGYMPEALSSHPQPYRRDGPAGPLPAGWAYPPKDYKAWADLVYRWVRHEVERYGPDQVQPWYWEVWNEPDTEKWQGTPEEYYKLYDFTADAVKRALPEARVGGPASSGPADAKAAAFLRAFLEHCVHGTNAATGQTGAPLDFISFHAKGAAAGFDIVSSLPELRKKPVILSESAMDVAALVKILDGARDRHINLAGVITWASDKPVVSVLRMLAKISGQQVKAQISGAPGVSAMAARSPRKLDVLVSSADAPATQVNLDIAGLPVAQIEMRQYRIDVEKTGELQRLGQPGKLEASGGKAAVSLRLPRHGVSLVELSW